MDFDPGGFGGGAQSFDGVARAAVGTDDAFFLGFRENVHDAFVAVGPVAFGETVHQTDVEMIRAEFAAEAVKIGTSGGGVTSPGFGKNGDFVARDMFEGLGVVRMAAIAVGGIEEAETVVVAVEEKLRETLNAECGLMRMMAGTN